MLELDQEIASRRFHYLPLAFLTPHLTIRQIRHSRQSELKIFALSDTYTALAAELQTGPVYAVG